MSISQIKVTYRRTIAVPNVSLTSELAIEALKHSTTQRLYSDSVFVMLVSVLIGNKRYCKFIKINQYTNALHQCAMSTSDETMREQHQVKERLLVVNEGSLCNDYLCIVVNGDLCYK